jgi:hypothetical protein
VDDVLILPIKSKIDPQFERQVLDFIAKADSRMPTVSEAELLRAGAGRREDQRLVADYVIGMLWLSWRFERAISMLDTVGNVAMAYIPSAHYLNLMRHISLLKNLPLFPVPRRERQSWTDLEKEARLIVYLKTGRLV